MKLTLGTSARAPDMILKGEGRLSCSEDSRDPNDHDPDPPFFFFRKKRKGGASQESKNL